jgi:hypothetical protein
MATNSLTQTLQTISQRTVSSISTYQIPNDIDNTKFLFVILGFFILAVIVGWIQRKRNPKHW